MSPIGTIRTSRDVRYLAANEGKADIPSKRAAGARPQFQRHLSSSTPPRVIGSPVNHELAANAPSLPSDGCDGSSLSTRIGDGCDGFPRLIRMARAHTCARYA